MLRASHERTQPMDFVPPSIKDISYNDFFIKPGLKGKGNFMTQGAPLPARKKADSFIFPPKAFDRSHCLVGVPVRNAAAVSPPQHSANHC